MILDAAFVVSEEITLLAKFFVTLLNGGQLLKERICPSGSKFFSVREDLILERLHGPNRKSQKLFLFVKMLEKHRGVHLGSLLIICLCSVMMKLIS